VQFLQLMHILQNSLRTIFRKRRTIWNDYKKNYIIMVLMNYYLLT